MQAQNSIRAFYSKNKTRQTIILIYLLVFVLLALAGVFLIVTSSRINKAYNNITDNAVQKLELLFHIQQNDERIQEITIDKVFHPKTIGEKENHELIKKTDETEKKLFEIKTHLQTTEEIKRWNELWSAWMMNKQNSNTLLSLGYEPAIDYYRKQGKPAFDNFHISVLSFANFLHQHIKVLDQEAGEYAVRSNRIINALIGSGLFLLLITGIMVIRNVRILRNSYSLLREKDKVLAESEQLYKYLFYKSPFPKMVCDRETLRFYEINEAATRLYGYSREEFLGLSAFDLRLQKDHEKLRNFIQRSDFCIVNRGIRTHITKDGVLIQVEIVLNEILYKGRQALLVSVNDVTEKLKAEELLKESETKFRSLIENSNDGIALYNIQEDVMTYASPSVERILGYPPSDIKGANPRDYIHPDDDLPVQDQLQYLIQHPTLTLTIIYRMKHKNGKWIWLQANVTNMLKEPSIGALVFNYEDITDKKIAEQKLIESEANLRAILENTNVAFHLLDPHFRIIAFNQLAFHWTFIQTGKELKAGTSYIDYVKEERRGPLAQLYQKALEGEEINLELSGYNNKTWHQVNMKRIVSAGNHILGLCISTTDITEKKRYEESIRNSKELYHTLFRKSPISAFVADKETLHIMEVNDKAVEKYGYTKEEFLNLTAYDLRLKEDYMELDQFLSSPVEEQNHIQLRKHVKKDGSFIYTELSIRTINYNQKETFLVLVNDITDRMDLQNKLVEEKVTKQIEITRATINAQEKERNEVGKELHDNVNQILTTARLYIDSAIHNPEQSLHFMEKGRHLINTGIEELRHISKSLVPPSLGDLTLKEALKEIAFTVKQTKKSVQLKLKGLKEEKMCNGLKIAVYRIVQEQMNNIIKHANAAEIHIYLRQYEDRLSLIVRDNGKGFDISKKKSGIGINNMISRAQAFNGKMNIDSSPGNGCVLSVDFSLNKNLPTLFN